MPPRCLVPTKGPPCQLYHGPWPVAELTWCMPFVNTGRLVICRKLLSDLVTVDCGEAYLLFWNGGSILNSFFDGRVDRKLRDGRMRLSSEDGELFGKSPGNTRGLNIRSPIYFGGINRELFSPPVSKGKFKRRIWRFASKKSPMENLKEEFIVSRQILTS